MHDLDGWDEVGSLKIGPGAVAPLAELDSHWHDIACIEKLVVASQAILVPNRA